MHPRRKLSEALEALNKAIDGGAEFPDVIGRIARKFSVDEDDLTQAYDAQ